MIRSNLASYSSQNLFCPVCSSMLKVPDLSQIQHCYTCTYKQTFQPDLHHTDKLSISSKYNQSLSVVHSSNEDQSELQAAAAQRATVQETCEKCGHTELTFYTMQMRSVDEGQTVCNITIIP